MSSSVAIVGQPSNLPTHVSEIDAAAKHEEMKKFSRKINIYLSIILIIITRYVGRSKI